MLSGCCNTVTSSIPCFLTSGDFSQGLHAQSHLLSVVFPNKCCTKVYVYLKTVAYFSFYIEPTNQRNTNTANTAGVNSPPQTEKARSAVMLPNAPGQRMTHDTVSPISILLCVILSSSLTCLRTLQQKNQNQNTRHSLRQGYGSLYFYR